MSELLMKINENKELKFKNFILTTNGYYYDKYFSEITESVDSLVFSLDSMNNEVAEKLWGMPDGTFKKVIDNINLAKTIKSQKKSKEQDIIISSAVSPGNINDLSDVYEFAAQNGFEFAACPQLLGVKAHLSLYGNESYIRFYDYLIKGKRTGGKIYGTIRFLQYMKDLKSFECKPFTMLVVSPAGEVFYPCLEKGFRYVICEN